LSNLCKTQLCAVVQNTVSSVVDTCDTTDILLSSVSVEKTEPTNRISKTTFNDLPDANTFPNGHVAYLDDAKVPVVASNGTWIGFDGRIVGSFFEGELWAWGSNRCGRLGDGIVATRCSPVREICSATNWCQVSAGYGHTLGIKTSGELWAWGGSACGRLGDGTLTDKCSPIREFCSATNWCQVSVGNTHSAAIKTSGELWAWGSNRCGRLGDGTLTTRCSPVREICSATNWCQVSAGYGHTLGIKTSGELWAWGSNASGRLGDGTLTNRCSPVREFCSATDWCQVSAENATAAIKTSGELWAWGNNYCGRLGDGTLTTRCSPVREICSSTDWCQVSAGACHSAAIKTSGELWAWGGSACGRLGDGTLTTRCSPVREISSSTDWCQVSAGDRHTAVIKTITCVCR
jgi:alpha-tubulin suppressor-like RCC1 family protein